MLIVGIASSVVAGGSLSLCHWRQTTIAAWLFIGALGSIPFLMAISTPMISLALITPLTIMLAISGAGLLMGPNACWITAATIGTAIIVHSPIAGSTWGLIGMIALGTMLLVPGMQLMHRALFRASHLDELADINVKLAVRAEENAHLLEQYRAVASGIPAQLANGKLIPFPRLKKAAHHTDKPLHAQLPKMYHQSPHATIADIQALVAQVGEHDGYTAAHSVAVAGYAKVIAEEMQLAEEAIMLLYQAALIHDVGKIGIPSEVLKKHGRLTETEWESMQSHTVMGAEMVRDLPALKNMEPLIRWHHERLDGSGYPDGLKGDEIPLLVRILSVADVFEAYTAERPYHSGRSLLEGIYWLQGECEAGRLDAQVVAAYERSLLQKKIYEEDDDTAEFCDIA